MRLLTCCRRFRVCRPDRRHLGRSISLGVFLLAVDKHAVGCEWILRDAGDAAAADEAKSASALPVKGRRLLNTKVIVATDLASRGIDTTYVRDVVLYDVPHTSIDFIHRLGRTGRMGRRGRGYVLVGRGDRSDIVSEVRQVLSREGFI